jgi:hypothetical protein
MMRVGTDHKTADRDFVPDEFRRKPFLDRNEIHFLRHDPLTGIVHL